MFSTFGFRGSGCRDVVFTGLGFRGLGFKGLGVYRRLSPRAFFGISF